MLGSEELSGSYRALSVELKWAQRVFAVFGAVVECFSLDQISKRNYTTTARSVNGENLQTCTQPEVIVPSPKLLDLVPFTIETSFSAVRLNFSCIVCQTVQNNKDSADISKFASNCNTTGTRAHPVVSSDQPSIPAASPPKFSPVIRHKLYPPVL